MHDEHDAKQQFINLILFEDSCDIFIKELFNEDKLEKCF